MRFLTPLIFLAAGLTQLPARADFQLRDGDTVAFLGDSITAARGYTKVVEVYTLMRFPERKVRFINAGQGGDTAFGCLERLERDVFSKGATVVTVAFGINDIGWGTKANPESRQKYLDGIRTIVTRCQERKVRPVICSPAITAEDPDTAVKGYLQTMTDDGLALAKSLGAGTIDLQRGMREIQRRVIEANRQEKDVNNHSTLHVKDGIHLSELGQLAMAFGILKGLDAPALVSSVSLDAGTLTLSGSEGCQVTDIQRQESGLSFTRLDQGLPMNLGVLSGLNWRFIPVPDQLNQYNLTVAGLPEGKYEILACGRRISTESSAALAKGVNMASMTANGWEPGGLWNAQSDTVKELVDARDKLQAAAVVREKFVTPHPEAAALAAGGGALDSGLTDYMRQMARPVPMRIEVRKAAE